MRKFPSIEQFKNAVKHVRDNAKFHNRVAPTLRFYGTVKLHGTNAAVALAPGGQFVYQSRERELSLDADNAGFMAWASTKTDIWTDIIAQVYALKPHAMNQEVVIYGEWCGGNIQSGVALAKLPKMFVIFNITLVTGEGEEEVREDLSPAQIMWVVEGNSKDVYTSYDFKVWSMDIDFENPSAVQNDLIEITNEVEQRCPVAALLGAEGVGEGVVWWNSDTGIKFKVKGEKHSVSKVKTLAPVDTERMASIAEFVDATVTENRLNQGLDKMRELGLPLDLTSTGAYLKWVVGDVLREEADTIEASVFEQKELTTEMSKRAKAFWFATVNKV